MCFTVIAFGRWTDTYARATCSSAKRAGQLAVAIESVFVKHVRRKLMPKVSRTDAVAHAVLRYGP